MRILCFASASAALALSCLALLHPASLSAQSLYGSLVGTVTDASNAAVPEAVVTVSSLETGTSRTAVTGPRGNYNIPNVRNGAYTVEIRKEGFRTVRRDNVLVSVDTVARVDIQMTVGQVSESITVAATAATLQTDRAEVRSEMTAKAITEIPVSGQRNYQSLFITVPGISPPSTPHSVPSNPSRSMQWQTNGNNTAANNTRIDGASATNVWLPHIASYVPALESIDTVSIVTNTFDADQGLAGGASVNVTIRSGSNQVNGAAFHYHQGNWSMARNVFLPSNQDIPKLVYNQFGGRIGGPIKKDKIFYFASYERTADHRFAGGLYTVPTAPMRLGDLSTSSLPVYDPFTGAANGEGRQPFANNRIPTARIHPTSALLMRACPRKITLPLTASPAPITSPPGRLPSIAIPSTPSSTSTSTTAGPPTPA
ncbi:MAG: carboxypeptidase regulatory-like domain-containing protein [Bryobacterales bacterium]|nr:carboxypeptidase regulatory-like domain-containing protein [Bryobacterales bacterium]